MAADLPEDILEAILNTGKPAVPRSMLTGFRARGDTAFENALAALTADGLLTETNDGFTLTETGRKKAASVARKHAVLASFLTDVLGAKPDEASKEACILEHKISNETINKLDTFMDEQSPEVPVYTDHHQLTQKNPIVPLIACEEGSILHVAMIQSFSKHSRLIDLGVIPGELISLRRKLDNDAVVIKVKGCDIALSPEVAANIMVERCCIQ
ncbi:MAG: metal-dependent transcriptional regulator [Methanocorpusculum sp.]|nr:metal-dependent transcriptional regulator [Methanocorpusculum sp.]